MLKSKQISRVLTQGLRQTEIGEKISVATAPLGIAMLSNDGLPLNLVSNDELFEGPYGSFSEDTFKIYSMVGMGCLTQTTPKSSNATEVEGSAGSDSWARVELDSSLVLVIQKLDYTESEEDSDKIFVAVFYDSALGDAIAKLKLDNVCTALAEGLKGYKRSLALAE